MKHAISRLSAQVQEFFLREHGQDLIEYALLAALLSLAATATLKSLAADINAAFVAIDTNLQGA